IITLTTDFGTPDWFAATMKGVILGVNQRATVVDITHEIPAGDIRAGAFALAASCRSFPERRFMWPWWIRVLAAPAARSRSKLSITFSSARTTVCSAPLARVRANQTRGLPNFNAYA